MRIAVITDAHANLPALAAALAAIRGDGPDAVYHTGDAIGIGPFPAETLDRLLHEPGLRLVMGNHDAWFAFGLPDPQLPWMGEGELAHQRWTHAQLDPALRPVVAAWPWVIEEEIGGVPVAFLHYALNETGCGFADPIPDLDPAALDRLFKPQRARLVFYGHVHHPTPVPQELVGHARYVNPGALGCSPEPLARYALLDIDHKGSCRLAFRAVPYDPASLFAAFEEREVPERAFITATFFGG
jgi:predicted phosphodiesterase